MISNPAELAQQVEPVFRRVLPTVTFSLDRSMANTGQWTSLKHIQLLSGLEKVFGIEFEAQDVARLTSIQAILEFLASRNG